MAEQFLSLEQQEAAALLLPPMQLRQLCGVVRKAQRDALCAHGVDLIPVCVWEWHNLHHVHAKVMEASLNFTGPVVLVAITQAHQWSAHFKILCDLTRTWLVSFEHAFEYYSAVRNTDS